MRGCKFMEWSKIKTFYYVAKAGGFTAAADKMHLSQSSLSRSVAKLEDQLDRKLFIRQAKGGLQFTREGEKLFKLAEKMISEINAIKKDIQGEENAVEGELKILTSPSLAADWLPFLIKDFVNNHPKIKLKIQGEIFSIEYHKYDVIIQPLISQAPDFKQQYLTTFQSALFASQDYINNFGKPTTTEELDKHRLLCFSEESTFPYNNTSWMLRIGKLPGEIRSPYMTLNSTRGLLHATKEGIGISQLVYGYPETFNIDLVNVLPDLDGPKTDIYFSYNENLKKSKKINTFKDYLLDKLNKNERNI